MVPEDGGLLPRRRRLQEPGEIGAVEDVVAEDKTGVFRPKELPPEDERLRKSVRDLLHLVGELHADAGAVPQEPLEVGQVLRRRDHQHLADAREHERGKRIEDHRLVVNRQKLLGHDPRQRMQARARAAGQYDSLACHGIHSPLSSHGSMASSVGCFRSFSESVSGTPISGHVMPSAGSSNRSPRSADGQ